MKRTGLILLFSISGIFLRAQDKYADSLNHVMQTAHDTIRIKALYKLLEHYEYNDIQKANDYARQIEDLALRLNIPRHIASAYIYYGNLFDDAGESDSAEYYYQKALDYAGKHSLKKRSASALNGLGCVDLRRGDYSRSLNFFTRSLGMYEELKDKSGQASCLNNMGLISKYIGKNDKALEYYTRSLKLKEEIGDLTAICNSYNNIGLLYYETGEYQKSKPYYLRALEMGRKNGDSSSVAMVLGNIALLYNEQYDTENALKYYKPSLDIYEKLGDKNGQATILANIGMVYHRKRDLPKCVEYNMRALAMFREMGARDWVTEIYKNLYQVYALSKDFDKAYDYHVKYVQLKDSIFTEENNKAYAEIETKYESEKKQKEIELLNQRAQIQTIELNKNRVILYSFIGGFILILLMSLVIYNRYKLKRTANVLLEKQNSEISGQKNVIEEKNKDITDSIHYAKRIQDAILPSPDKILHSLPGSFVLFRPKDIVSGDFYYFNELGDAEMIIAAADCTGHGVPGAFMSILGFNALEQAINENKQKEPSGILNQINAIISTTLNQGNKEQSVKDGMDIALCHIDKKSRQIRYAGANNPLWVISGNELFEYKANKKPIGVSEGTDSGFISHTIQLKEGDAFYLFSDGYADQFGGEKGKKFKYKQLKELLLSFQDQPMKEQHDTLDTVMNKWKGNLEQIDDILIIGGKL
jgi:serine phosphatase RsbU (regulator of sigma subunit)